MGNDADDMAKHFQDFMKKGFVMIVPTILFGGALATAVWRHVIEDGLPRSNGMKGFMVLVSLQLLPLAVLKVKTWLCADRVSLVPLALVKTVIMHVFLQVLRLLSNWFNADTDMALEQFLNVAYFVLALYLLDKEFDLPIRTPLRALAVVLAHHKDVISLCLGACAAGFMTEFISPSNPMRPNNRARYYVISIANFMEVLTFMPAVQMVCMEIDSWTPGKAVEPSEKRKVKVFMAFILSFYLWDDVIYCTLMGEDAIVAAAKCAHFFMLLDFAGFFVLKVGAGPKFVEGIVSSVVAPPDAEAPQRNEQMQGLMSGVDDDDDDMF